MTSSSPSSLFLSLQGWIRWYSAKLDTHPLLTMMVTSGLIAGGGDALCQFLVGMMEKSQGGGGGVVGVVVPYDIWRTARFTLLGTVVVAPSVHAWYTVLNRVVSGVTVAAVVQRVAADQLIFSPAFLSLWLPSLWILEGDACNKDMAHRLVTCLPGVVVANWTLWVPAQVVNFRWIAPKYQVLFSNLTDLVWNVYLSYLNASGQEYKLEYDPPTIHNS